MEQPQDKASVTVHPGRKIDQDYFIIQPISDKILEKRQI